MTLWTTWRSGTIPMLCGALASCVAIPVESSPSRWFEAHESDYWAMANPPLDAMRRDTLIVGFYPHLRYMDKFLREEGDKVEAAGLTTLVNVLSVGLLIPINLLLNWIPSWGDPADEDFRGGMSSITLVGYVKTSENPIPQEHVHLLQSGELTALFQDFEPSRRLAEYVDRVAAHSGLDRDTATVVAGVHYGRAGLLYDRRVTLAAARDLLQNARTRVFVVTEDEVLVDPAAIPAAVEAYGQALASLAQYEARYPAMFANQGMVLPLADHHELAAELHAARASAAEFLVGVEGPLAGVSAEAVRAMADPSRLIDDHLAVVRIGEQQRPMLQALAQQEPAQRHLDAMVGLEGTAHANLARLFLRQQQFIEADRHRKRALELLPTQHPAVVEMQKVFEGR